MPRSKAAAALALIAALAGCGGGSKSAADVPTIEQCVRDAKLTVRENPVTGAFKNAGIQHALVAILGPRTPDAPVPPSALLLFAKDDGAAKDALATLEHEFGTQAGASLPIRRKGSVLVSWLSDTPKGGDATIDRCLAG